MSARSVGGRELFELKNKRRRRQRWQNEFVEVIWYTCACLPACSAKANLKADREKERIWMFGVNLYTSSFSFSAFLFLSLSFTLCHSSNWWARISINISINGFFGLSLSHSLNHTTSLDCSRFLVSVEELSIPVRPISFLVVAPPHPHLLGC